MTRWLLFLMLTCPGMAVAQSEGHEWMLDELRACYDAAEDFVGKTACIGTMSSKCQETEEGGYTTFGMASCNNDEYQAWDVLLNVEYQATKAAFEAWDTDEAEYFPEYANRVETLRDAQRAWIAFRDAECALEYAIWGSGSMRHIAGTGCLLDETAKRTIALWAMRVTY